MRPVSLLFVLIHTAAWILPKMSSYGIFGPWIAPSVLEWIFGIGFLVLYEEFEKRLGARKYASYSFILILVAIIMGIFKILPLRMGLYPLVFGWMPFYIADIPAQIAYILFGRIKVSTKWFVYLLAIQMMFSSYPNSINSAICGFISGILLKARFLPIRKFRIPRMIYALLAKLCGWIYPANIQLSSTQRNSTQSAIPMSRQADPELLANLIALGFDASEARQALIRTNNNLEQASNILLDAYQR
jgi:hypothetical protein